MLLSLLRIILVGFTFGSPSTMLFSLGGGLVSWFLMVCAKKIKGLSMTGVSILGGIGHNLGQIIVGAMLTTRIRKTLFFEDIHS